MCTPEEPGALSNSLNDCSQSGKQLIQVSWRSRFTKVTFSFKSNEFGINSWYFYWRDISHYLWLLLSVYGPMPHMQKNEIKPQVIQHARLAIVTIILSLSDQL